MDVYDDYDELWDDDFDTDDEENCPRTAPHIPHLWDFDDEDGPVELYCPGQ